MTRPARLKDRNGTGFRPDPEKGFVKLIRDRKKVRRGLKKKDTAILKGMQVYHNFIKPHEGLDGKTPAEACGIVVNGENKWMTLIQNSAQETR